MPLPKITRVMQQIAKYRKSGEHIPSLEKDIAALEPYLGKRGGILKRATRSKKQKAAFKGAVESIKANPYLSAKNRRAIEKKKVSSLQEHGYVDDKTQGKKLIRFFADYTRGLLGDTLAIGSDQIIRIFESGKVSADDLVDVARFVKRQFEDKTPDWLWQRILAESHDPFGLESDEEHLVNVLIEEVKKGYTVDEIEDALNSNDFKDATERDIPPSIGEWLAEWSK